MLKQILIIFCISSFVWCQRQPSEEQIEYYENLIIKAQRDAQTYQLPRNNRRFEAPPGTRRRNAGIYDFIVIGAGSAGTVIANRLSENKNWKILLLEAGGFGNNVTDIPYLYMPSQFTEYNWGYNSIPQKTACQGMEDQICAYPRGLGVGGSTLINTVVYARGCEQDFDKWASEVGDDQWAFNNVLPYFKKSENYVHNDPEAPVLQEFHGEDGYLTVDYHMPKSVQIEKIFDANKEIGFGINDYNANQLGASATQINTRNGSRLDNGKAFIDPVLDRKNLVVLTRSFVTKLIINKSSKQVEQVEFNRNGKKYYAKASKETILSAGVFGSAQILMLSGIGPKSHLIALGIEVIENLEVGTTLHDHSTFYGLNFETNNSVPSRPLKDDVKEFLSKGEGPLAAPNNQQGLGFYESQYTRGTGVPDIELLVVPSVAITDLSQKGMRFTNQTYEDVWAHANRNNSLNILVIALHAYSKGTFRLKSKDPFEFPIIDSRFLSDPDDHDINILYEGVKLALKIINTPAFKAINATLQSAPLRACKRHNFPSKSYWFCALRQVTANLYHPSSTCKMGPDPRKGAVVDSKLRVHGVRGLRIADASVLPFTLAGHPNAPVTMIGEVLSDILKKKWK